MLLSLMVSWLLQCEGSGVMESDAGQDTGSACSVRQGKAAASDCTPSGLGKAWHMSGYGLFQWEMPMAT